MSLELADTASDAREQEVLILRRAFARGGDGRLHRIPGGLRLDPRGPELFHGLFLGARTPQGARVIDAVEGRSDRDRRLRG